jgi:hypothetical protein
MEGTFIGRYPSTSGLKRVGDPCTVGFDVESKTAAKDDGNDQK